MVKSPIKIIDSGTAPTTANLGEGQIAFGTVDGATKLYGSDGTTITDLTTSGGQGPQGPQGEPGAPGAAATVTVGTTTTGEAGTQAAVTNSGTTSAAVLNFTIPKGAKGDKGDKGDTGSTGPAGTTTFAGLTDQPTDNAALKTALDAKANQTAVDSLTATVNGKVSSVTAGEGISITGTATEPVISATGGAVISGFRPDYAAKETLVEDEYGTEWTWNATGDGLINANATYSDGNSYIRISVNGVYVDEVGLTKSGTVYSNYVIVSVGDVVKFEYPSTLNVVTFTPLKNSTITPDEFTDTGWMEITASSGSGLKYLAGPWAIPSGSSLRIRKFGTHVTVSGVIQCTEDIAKGDQQFLLSISSSDSHFNELHLPDNGSVEIPRKCGGMIYITEATSARPSFQAQAMVSISDNGKAIAAYITVVDFLYGYAQESIPNGSAIGLTFSWDTEG